MAAALLAGAAGHFAVHGTANGVSGAGGHNTSTATGVWMGLTYIAGVPPTPSDSYGNNWALVDSIEGVVEGVALYVAENPGGGNPLVGSGHTFSALATGCYAAMEIIAASGTKIPPTLDKKNKAVATSNSITPGIVAPATDGQILITILGAYEWTGTTVIGDSFTVLDQIAIDSGVSFDIAAAIQIQTTATTRTPSWAAGSGTGYCQTVIGTFQAAVAGEAVASSSGVGTATGVSPTAGGSVAAASGSAASSVVGFAAVMVYPIADITANGWLPSSGSDLYAVLDETTVDHADYAYSPTNPTTQQFEVKLGPFGLPRELLIGLRAINNDTAFDINLVQGSTVLDSWTETVTVAQGNVIRSRVFSGGVVSSVTDSTNVRVRVVARAP